MLAAPVVDSVSEQRLRGIDPPSTTIPQARQGQAWQGGGGSGNAGQGAVQPRDVSFQRS